MSRIQIIILYLIICTLSFIAYSNSFETPYHYDDAVNILRNSNVHMESISLDSLEKTLFAGGERGKIYHPILYRPVAMFSFALNYYFGKLEPFGYHVVNFMIHLTACLFLFLFTADFLKLLKYDKAHYIAFIATALWAVNPVQLTAITYIVQRMTSLAGMFYIAAMFFYLRARTGKSLKHATCALLAAILAVFTKENAIMVFASVAIFDFIFFEHRHLKRDIGIMAAVAVIGLLLAVAVQGWEIFSIKTLEEGFAKRDFTLGQRLLTEPRVIVFYLMLLFFPSHSLLSLTHDVPISTGLLSPPATLFSMIIIACLIGLAIVSLKRYPLFSWAVFFFFLNHVIEGSIFPIELVYEHRNYVPSMFLFLPVALVLMHGYRKYGKLVAAVAGCILIFFITNTYQQNAVWKTDLTLWQDTVEKSPDPRSMFNLGGAYYTIYREDGDKGALEAAAKYFKISRDFNQLFGTNYVESFDVIPYGRVMFMAQHNAKMLDMQRSGRVRPGWAVPDELIRRSEIEEESNG